MRAILMFHSEDKVTRQCPQTTAVFEEKEKKESRSEIGPRPFCYALLLGQTVSLSLSGSLSPKLVKAG